MKVISLDYQIPVPDWREEGHRGIPCAERLVRPLLEGEMRGRRRFQGELLGASIRRTATTRWTATSTCAARRTYRAGEGRIRAADREPEALFQGLRIREDTGAEEDFLQ